MAGLAAEAHGVDDLLARLLVSNEPLPRARRNIPGFSFCHASALEPSVSLMSTQVPLQPESQQARWVLLSQHLLALARRAARQQRRQLVMHAAHNVQARLQVDKDQLSLNHLLLALSTAGNLRVRLEGQREVPVGLAHQRSVLRRQSGRVVRTGRRVHGRRVQDRRGCHAAARATEQEAPPRGRWRRRGGAAGWSGSAAPAGTAAACAPPRPGQG